MSAGVIAAHYVASNYAAEVLADSPLSYLKFDETSGTTANDSSGNLRHETSANCTVNQATVMPSGVASYDFNGTSSQVSIADAAWQRPTAFTIEAWINADALPASLAAIAAKDGPGSGWAFYLSSSGKLNCYTNGGGHQAATTLSTGTDNHVVVTYDPAVAGGTLKIYLNNTLDLHNTSVLMSQTSGTSLLTGVSTGSNGGASRFFWFNGRIDERAYYGTALSAARVAAHYAAR